MPASSTVSLCDLFVQTNVLVKMQENSPGAGKCRSLRHDDQCVNFKSGHEGVFFADFFLESAGLDNFSLIVGFVFSQVFLLINLVGQIGTFKNIKKISQKR